MPSRLCSALHEPIRVKQQYGSVCLREDAFALQAAQSTSDSAGVATARGVFLYEKIAFQSKESRVLRKFDQKDVFLDLVRPDSDIRVVGEQHMVQELP